MSKTYYYFTDFEDGQYGGIGEHSGTFEYSTIEKKDGSYSFRVSSLGGTATGQQSFQKSNASGKSVSLDVSTVYAKFDFLYKEKPTSSNRVFFQVKDSSGLTKLGLALRSDGKIDVYSGAVVFSTTSTLILSPNIWYRIEVKCGTGASAVGEVRIDGLGVSSTVGLGSNLCSYCVLGSPVDDSTIATPYDFYFDNLILADAWVGDAYVTRALPNGNGPVHDWNSGTGTTYLEVDDTVIDGTTTELKNAAAGANETNQVVFPACSISNPIRALMAQAICRITNMFTPGKVRIDTTVSGGIHSTTPDLPGSSSYNTLGTNSFRVIWSDSFVTGLEWTPSELSTIQIGLVATEAKQVGCTQVCYKLIVDRSSEGSASPSSSPSSSVSSSPSSSPSATPSASPSSTPSASPSPSSSPSSTPSASPSPSTSPSATPSTSPSGSPSTSPSASPSGSPSVSPSASPSASPSVSPSPPQADKIDLTKVMELAFNRTGEIPWGMNVIDFLRDRLLAPGASATYTVDLTLTYNDGNITQATIAGGDGQGVAGMELKVAVIGLAI